MPRLSSEACFAPLASSGPHLNRGDDQCPDTHGKTEGPEHETVKTPGQHIEALVDGLEALIHLLQDRLDQLALVLQFLLDTHHALAQLDLVDGGRLAERLFSESQTQVLFDELDVFFSEGHG
jgi:hypothetical protein